MNGPIGLDCFLVGFTQTNKERDTFHEVHGRLDFPRPVDLVRIAEPGLARVLVVAPPNAHVLPHRGAEGRFRAGRPLLAGVSRAKGRH